MNDEVELISDGESLALIGAERAVERFLKSVGRLSSSRPLDADRFGRVLRAGAAVAEGAASIAATSGRYLKLDKESAAWVKEIGLMETDTPGLSYAMIGRPGDIGKWLKVETGLQALATNPAVLSGVGNILSQIQAQQSMADITAALARLDEKVDDILRKQDDAVLAELVGIGHAIDRAVAIHRQTGEVNATLWSSVAHSHQKIGAAQSYALSQLASLAEGLESTRIGELASVARQAEAEIPQWLAVIARCFQLAVAVDLLEFERSSAETPDKALAYDQGMTMSRLGHREPIAERTRCLLDRVDQAVRLANEKIFWNRVNAGVVVEAANRLGADIHEFHQLLRIEENFQQWEERPLGTAAAAGAQAVERAKQAAPAVAGIAALGLSSLVVKKLQGNGVDEKS